MPLARSGMPSKISSAGKPNTQVLYSAGGHASWPPRGGPSMGSGYRRTVQKLSSLSAFRITSSTKSGWTLARFRGAKAHLYRGCLLQLLHPFPSNSCSRRFFVIAVARAFLVLEKTLGQRISRAKKTLSEAQLPFET